MKRILRTNNQRLLVFGLLAGALFACSHVHDRPDSSLPTDRAWTGEPPEDAEIISGGLLQRLYEAGDLVLVTPDDAVSQQERIRLQHDQDLAYLRGLPSPSPAIKRLLEEANVIDGPQGDRDAALSNGQQVRLLGLSDELRMTVEAHRRSLDVEHARGAYALAWSQLPETLRRQATAPEALAGAPLDSVLTAKGDVDRLLDTQVQLVAEMAMHRNLLEPWVPLIPNLNCTRQPQHLVRLFWFPLKHFVPPIRDQGPKRGTCWAFAALGALESRELVQRNRSVNLSEQFLVHRYKLSWYPDHFGEGGGGEAALDMAQQKGQSIPREAHWPYNPSAKRSADEENRTYSNSCDDYAAIDSQNRCSNTAHQGPRFVCATIRIPQPLTFCGYVAEPNAASGISSGSTRLLWTSGQAFPLATLRSHLANGHVLIASYPVYQGFDAAVNGYVTDYDTSVERKRGGHIVQLIGFIGNAQLTAANMAPAGGGGYFILKNSWGCGHGDGGYWYVPADYVETVFGQLSLLEFDQHRGSRWQQEQVSPGHREVPVIDVLAASAEAQVRVPFNIRSSFRVTHSTQGLMPFTVRSDRDGVLYDGVISTRLGGFAQPLNVTFNTLGRHQLTVTARSSTNRAVSATATVQVRNSPPTIRLHGADTAIVGEPYLITAAVDDLNEPADQALCSRTSWSIATPDAVNTPTGCEQTVTFGSPGTRNVSATVRDREGLMAAHTLAVRVSPVPENPYPRVTGASLRSGEFMQRGQFSFCGSLAVARGATIDVGARGCGLAIGGTRPQRYHAQVNVENPDGETLRYDWKLLVTVPGGEQTFISTMNSTSNTFGLHNGRNNISQVTRACRITVDIKAADPSRNKSLTVWSGRCTYNASYLG